MGSQYKTAMGFSFSSNSSCPIGFQDSLIQTISAQDNCGHIISDCDMIHSDNSLQNIGGGVYKCTISNIIDMNGSTPPNITNMEVVVHQPYKNYCLILAPYLFSKPMAPFSISGNTTGPTYTAPLTGPILNIFSGMRAFNVTGFPFNFGSVGFNINIPTSFISTNCPSRSIPVNISFWDKNASPCPTLCEKTIYLSF